MNTEYYNQKHLEEISRKGYYNEKINFFLDELRKSDIKNPKILDIACNDGYLSEMYSNYGEVLGIDINERALKQCRKRGVNCLKSDVSELPSKYDNYFDFIVAGDIIEHIFDTDLFLDSIYNKLKKNGTLLLTTPNLASLGRRIMLLFGLNPYIEYSNLLPSKEFNVGHIRYYTKKNLEDQLYLHKFRNISVMGDKMNITENISLPFFVSKYFPNFARNLMVRCIK